MVIVAIVVVTVVVFILVDIGLRFLLNRWRESKTKLERQRALDLGLKLDVSEEAKTLKRVEVEQPKARILAVDDESIILDSFRKILVLNGYSIDTVERGDEALGLIRKYDYDFVFTDLKMPEMDGVEVTKTVKHMRPDIDVIVITGYGSIETAVETVKAGAMDYVQKPFTEEELLGFVNKALIRRQDKIEKQMRHKVRLLKYGIDESRSRFALNVPGGVFISSQHAWARIELNGMVRIGPDDFIRKVFERIDRIALPKIGAKLKKGEPLFSLQFADASLDIPSPISGTVTLVNREHSDHPEWLAIKPFELGWMCVMEPSSLATELALLRIGRDSVNWYEEELHRYYELADQLERATQESAPEHSGDKSSLEDGDYRRLMVEFSKLFVRIAS
jgi:CheY-like chemotaxis protein